MSAEARQCASASPHSSHVWDSVGRRDLWCRGIPDEKVRGVWVGVADEYGTIWSGQPGASERIGDLSRRSDDETMDVYLELPRLVHDRLRDLFLDAPEVSDVLAKPGQPSPSQIYKDTGGGEPFRREMFRRGYVVVVEDARCPALLGQGNLADPCQCLLKRGHKGDHLCQHGDWSQ